MDYIKVTSVAHLKELCAQGRRHYFIALTFGLRSSKFITYACGTFCIVNEIDDSEQICSERTLDEDTNIVEGIDRGAFYCEY